MAIDILARKTIKSDECGCGSHNCTTALEAVMLEINGQFPNTKDCYEVSASDDNVIVVAYKMGEGKYDVNIYADAGATHFICEV